MNHSGPYVSRGGMKLAAALDAFGLDVAGSTCADAGCSHGGFTDCLLQHGALKVYAVDTGYGLLEWKLRQDDRVAVLERTNILHFDPACLPGFAGCDLVVLDVGWTRQGRVIPAAIRWLAPHDQARIVTLIKPQYEASREQLDSGVLADDVAMSVTQQVIGQIPAYGARVIRSIVSPIRGGGKRTKSQAGNTEYLALLARS